MLWYKSWLETRTRFLTTLASLTLFGGLFVYHALETTLPAWNVDFNRLLYITQEFLALMWILSAILLGTGGIVHEKTVGTAALTLSLPVSRARLQFVRIGVGVLQATALAVLPWVAILVISWHAKMPFLTMQVGMYVLLLTAGGLVYYAMAVLVSSIFEGGYSSPAIAIGLVFVVTIVLDSWFRRFNLWRFVTGDFYLDPHTFLLARHIPWSAMFFCVAIATLMFFASIMAIVRRDF